MDESLPPGAWTRKKVDAFKKAFFTFLKYVRINSKEKGGNYCLADGVYQAQHRLLDGIFDALAGDVHDVKCLKARQLGCTTIMRALDIFWLGVHDGIQGAFIIDTDPHKEESRREIESMIDNLPAVVKFPRIMSRNRNMLLLTNGSKLLFMSAGVKKSKSSGVLGRSSGLNFIHASEMCSWDNDEGLTSLKNSLSENFENRLYIWESTARGFNQWHRMWEQAKLDDLNQRTIFIGWWAKETQRLKQGTPAFERYGTPTVTSDERARIADVKVRYGVDVDIEQIAWYRRKMDPAFAVESENEIDLDDYALQDQPWSEEESFQITGSTFFSAERLTEIAASAAMKKFKAYHYHFTSEFFSSDIRVAKRKKEIQLKIFDEPQNGGIYVISGDPAFGHDEANDRSAAQVLRCYADGVDQVAEFADPLTPTHQFAWSLASLVSYYSLGPDRLFTNPVYLIIEVNGPGEAVWNEYKSLERIVRAGYARPNAALRGLENMFQNVRQYVYTRSDAMVGGHNWHWKTSGQLKEAIMERLRDATHQQMIRISSYDTLLEMRSIVREGSSIRGAGKSKDDRVYALAMAYRAYEERARPALIAANRTREVEKKRAQLDPIDRYALFNRYQFSSFLKKQEHGRVDQIWRTRQNWRDRVGTRYR